MKNTIILLFLFFVSSIFAQQTYYNDVDLNLSGIALKAELATKITNTHARNLSYSQAREALKIVDLVPEQGDNVLLLYGYSPDLCPSSPGNDDEHRRRDKSNFDDGGNDPCLWNREHTYPKALGSPNLGTSGPGADAHMLRACDKKRNGQRGNLKFNGGSGNSGTSGSGWYPGDEWKGDVARMMMYMYLRYGDRCYPDNVGYGSSVANDTHMIDLFLEWNAEDPVSTYEDNRNDYLENTSNIYGQGNRNPFIDNPYLATRIWGGTTAEDRWGIYVGISEIQQLDFSIYPNPSNGNFYINGLDHSEITKIEVLDLQGSLISKQKFNTENTPIYLPPLNAGLFLIRINTATKSGTRKLLIE